MIKRALFGQMRNWGQTIIIVVFPRFSAVFLNAAILVCTFISHLYLPAFVLAAAASIGGAWAWTIASQRLPMALASQLLSMEMVFATCLGLLFYYRWPTAPEAMGITLIVVGVVRAIGAFHGNPGKTALAH